MSVVAVLGLILFPAPWLWGTLGLLAAVLIFLHSLGLSVSTAEFCLLAGLIAAVPLAAWLAGRFVDRFAFGTSRSACFSVLAVALAFSVFVDSGLLSGALKAVLQVLAQGAWGRQLVLAGAIGNAVIFCAGLVSFVLMMLVLMVELPFVWFSRRDRSGAVTAIGALRPLLLVLALSLVFNHVSGLFYDELAPMMLIRNALG
jgi:hypothetical protein